MHAQACSTTIGDTLTLRTGQAATAKKQKAADDENFKKGPGSSDSTTRAVQTGSLKSTTPLIDGLRGSDSATRSTRGSKRKSTMTPIDVAQKAQKKRRR